MRSVLLVDDDPIQCSALAELLGDEQLSVEIATTGAEALARIQPSFPDVVVSDVGLPDMDAASLIRCARRIRPALDIIVLTGYTKTSAGVVAALALDAVYLAKPVTVSQLLATLASLEHA